MAYSITLSDELKIALGIFWGDTRMEYDVNNNLIYAGFNLEEGAAQGDNSWWIVKMEYDGSFNMTRCRVLQTTWTARAAGWS